MNKLLLVVSVFKFIWSVNLLRLNVTGGKFHEHKYMDSHVILAYERVGPKMCLKDCMLHKECNGVNFRRERLRCELLIVSYPGDELADVSGTYFSEIDTWTQDKSPCWPNPCTSRTKCEAAYHDQFICVTYDTPCDIRPCQNKGICRNDVSSYRCICPDGFYGKNCEYTPCTSQPCTNDGSCSVSGSGFSCSCPNGYSGTTCENTPCTPQPCKNGGSCSVSGSTFSCSCPHGYSGSTCETTPCSPRPCNNGGTCSISGSGYNCNCLTGYYGTTCEHKI